MPEPMVLLLEDGFVLVGERGGRATHASGEVVINTCMSGYQEVLSDPSYAGQMVVMTYPLIGNYGAAVDFQESARPWARALITRQLSRFEQHWRSHQSLVEWLDGFGIPILTGCDTRRLARHLRATGAQRAIIGPRQDLTSLRERVQRVPALEEQDLVRQVSEGFTDVVERLDPALLGRPLRQWPGLRVVVVDYGVKRNTLRSLRTRGVEVEVLPRDSGFVVSHRNLHDGSVEGLIHARLPVRSVQFHPEGGPGPQDNQVIFDEFLDLVAGRPAPIAQILSRPPRPNTVLVIGSGPIVIGQAAEFDYAGTQACKALREEGVRTVLVNSNPATIMTDEGVADRVYIEPLTIEAVTAIIERERPDGLLATLGGQTGLNLAVALADAGVLERCQVRVLGTPLAAIREAEDREAVKNVLLRTGAPAPESRTVNTVDAAQDFAAAIGFPLVVRPAYTLGGTGGGMAGSPLELEAVVREGLAASPIRQVLVERAVIGRKDIEYVEMRDANDTCIAVA